MSRLWILLYSSLILVEQVFEYVTKNMYVIFWLLI